MGLVIGRRTVRVRCRKGLQIVKEDKEIFYIPNSFEELYEIVQHVKTRRRKELEEKLKIKVKNVGGRLS